MLESGQTGIGGPPCKYGPLMLQGAASPWSLPGLASGLLCDMDRACKMYLPTRSVSRA